MYDLQGQVALVTGAGGEHGIGYAIARRLAEEGADVVVNDVSARPYPDAEWGGLDAAVAAIEALGRAPRPWWRMSEILSRQTAWWRRRSTRWAASTSW